MAQNQDMPDMIATESLPGPTLLLILLMLAVPAISLFALYQAATALYAGLSWFADAILRLPESGLLQIGMCLISSLVLFCFLRFLGARCRPPKFLGSYLLQSRTVYYKSGRRYSPSQWQARQDASFTAGLLPEP